MNKDRESKRDKQPFLIRTAKAQGAWSGINHEADTLPHSSVSGNC
jgi:hypothetical protein